MAMRPPIFNIFEPKVERAQVMPHQTSITQWIKQQRKSTADPRQSNTSSTYPMKRLKSCEDMEELSTDLEAGSSQESILSNADCDSSSQSVPLKECTNVLSTALDSTREIIDENRLEQCKMIKDSVHGCIYLEPVCMAIIDTVHFQRLRHLKQLGASNFVYMGATHTRFEHSIGVAYLAEYMLGNIKKNQQYLDINRIDILCVKIAGLCHDLGHGPFSHVYDGIFMKQLEERGENIEEMAHWTHEQGSIDMLDALIADNSIHLENYGLTPIDYLFIKELILGHPLSPNTSFLGRPSKPYLYEVVNNSKSGLDVDKLDYFLRDAIYTGVKAGCDTELLLTTVRVLADSSTGELGMCWPDKLVGQVMKVFQTRYELHQTVYQHKVTRAIEYMICDALLEADGHFKIKGKRISQAPLSMDSYKHLDDRILALIENSENSKLIQSQLILKRISMKPLYKCIGTTEITFYSKNKNENEIKMELLKIQPKLNINILIIEKNNIHYGLKEKDPIEKIRFYNKNTKLNGKSFQLNKKLYFMHCPKKFIQFNIRLFIRDIKYYQLAYDAMVEWCKWNGSYIYIQED